MGMLSAKNAAEELKIDQMTILGWHSAGSRKVNTSGAASFFFCFSDLLTARVIHFHPRKGLLQYSALARMWSCMLRLYLDFPLCLTSVPRAYSPDWRNEL